MLAAQSINNIKIHANMASHCYGGCNENRIMLKTHFFIDNVLQGISRSIVFRNPKLSFKKEHPHLSRLPIFVTFLL